MTTTAVQEPAPVHQAVRVPVTVRVGEQEILLCRMTTPGDPLQLDDAALGHLLRMAAEVVDGRRHEWPRARWCVGDRVRLPGSAAYARVVQVDPHAKTYLLDCGSRGLSQVWWGDLDDPGDLEPAI